MRVEKFPLFFWKGRPLLWDTRQPMGDNDKPIVVIRKNLAPEVRASLELISSDRLYEGSDFPSWGSFVSELCGEPSRSLRVLGVVGTNGKTSTNSLLRFLLVEQGLKVLELGTLGASVWDAHCNEKALWKESTGFTSPEAPTLQDLLKQAKAARVDVVVMEVTSHALALGRVEGVDFDGGAFLNLSQDHLDFHKTLEEYKRVKKSFFLNFLKKQKYKRHPSSVVNVGDSTGKEIAQELKLSTTLLRNRDYRVVNNENGVGVEFPMGTETHEYSLYGDFWGDNICVAVELLESVFAFDKSEMLLHLKKFKGVPGRMESLFLSVGKTIKKVIVDFAHTPEALEKALLALRDSCKGDLWVLFGCGGDRDTLKRPLMGAIAAKIADRVIVTSDNPRSEKPESIIDQIAEGITQKEKTKCIVNRREAIRFALENLKPNDLCLVAGRGHEEFQVVGTQKIPFSDIQVLNDLSKELSPK